MRLDGLKYLYSSQRYWLGPSPLQLGILSFSFFFGRYMKEEGIFLINGVVESRKYVINGPRSFVILFERFFVSFSMPLLEC